MKEIDGTYLDKDDLVVVLGKHNIRNWAKRSILRDVKRMYAHPEYQKPGHADLAIIVMDSPVNFEFNVKPVCIWNEGER